MSELARKMSKEDLELLSKLASKYNVEVEQPKLPVMKINYDPDSIHPRGAWIVGQTKDENGGIVDEGRLVKEFILLGVYNRYSLYNEADTKKNCRSPLHTIGQVGSIRGDNYGYICGSKCPHRAFDANPRCFAQKVLFGVAITEAGEEVDCIVYIKGTSYMAFVDYMKKHPTRVGKVAVPIFAHSIKLGSRKEKNKGAVYFVAKFETGNILNIHKIQELAKKAEGVTEFVESMNNITQKTDVETTSVIDTEAKVTEKKELGMIEDLDDIPDDVVKLDKVEVKEDDPEDDIEAKIASLLGDE